MSSNFNPELVVEYFKELDHAIEKLSQKKEGLIVSLPGWVLIPKEITVGITKDGMGVAIKIMPNEELEKDHLNYLEISTIEQFQSISAPWTHNFSFNKLKDTPFFQVGNLLIVTDNPLQPPLEERGLWGFGNAEGAARAYTKDKAKLHAIDFWNNIAYGFVGTKNFVQEVRQIFRIFKAIVKRKAFMERRIHRFLNEHAKILLPPYKRFFFEHKVWLGQEFRQIDFILEKESGLPPLLIELESPAHKVFRKNGEPTQQTNHAKNQIAEWISFIDKEASINATGEYSFLSGPKQRLVIIGRGLEYRKRLIESKYTDTTIWTYDLLIEEARARWNDLISSQYQIVGLREKNPF